MSDSTPRPAAPSSFKVLVAPGRYGNTAADDAAQHLGGGFASVVRNAEITLAPMPDGGKGTSSLFAGERVTLPTTDAAGALTEATYTLDTDSATAYIDAAAVCGAPAGIGDSGDTYGVGVLIADAATRGAKRVVLALGDVETIDGGTGILVALGVNPLDKQGYSLPKGAAALTELNDFDTATVNITAGSMEWVLLTDDDAGVDSSHPGLARLAEVAGVDPSTAGYGAGGAIPLGLHWLSNTLHGSDEYVHVVSGSEVITQAFDLKAHIAGADLVITGGTTVDPAEGVTSRVLEAARGTGTVVGVVARDLDGELDEDIVYATATNPAELREAGAAVASDYLKISTVQG